MPASLIKKLIEILSGGPSSVAKDACSSSMKKVQVIKKGYMNFSWLLKPISAAQ